MQRLHGGILIFSGGFPLAEVLGIKQRAAHAGVEARFHIQHTVAHHDAFLGIQAVLVDQVQQRIRRGLAREMIILGDEVGKIFLETVMLQRLDGYMIAVGIEIILTAVLADGLEHFLHALVRLHGQHGFFFRREAIISRKNFIRRHVILLFQLLGRPSQRMLGHPAQLFECNINAQLGHRTVISPGHSIIGIKKCTVIIPDEMNKFHCSFPFRKQCIFVYRAIISY